jgi:phosphoglycolate phosphatase-like HAD superfamily hydrolase
LDLDGTLVNVKEKYCRLHTDIARELNREPLPGDLFWALKRQGVSLETLLEDWDEPARQAYNRRWLDEIEAAAYTRLDTLMPSAPETLSALAMRFKLVLATMRRDGLGLRRQLHWLGIRTFFSDLLVAADYRSTVYTKAQLLRPAFSMNGGRAVVVGDSEADVEAARELGVPSICVLTGIRDRRFLQALHPDYIVESIDQLPELMGDVLGAEVAEV